MSMSTHVVGFVPPDQQWQQLKAVHDACTAAGIEVPSAVEMVIGSNPTEYGREVEIPVVKWSDDAREGYDVDVLRFPLVW